MTCAEFMSFKGAWVNREPSDTEILAVARHYGECPSCARLCDTHFDGLSDVTLDKCARYAAEATPRLIARSMTDSEVR